MGLKKDMHVADRNITVYKVLLKNNYETYRAPYHMDARYFVGHINSVPQLKPVVKKGMAHSIEILEGLHCFSENSVIQIETCVRDVITVNVCQPELRLKKASFTFCDTFWNYEHYKPVVAKCIIPKYTVYYQNICGHIVTETLLVKEIFEITEEHKLGMPINEWCETRNKYINRL